MVLGRPHCCKSSFLRSSSDGSPCSKFDAVTAADAAATYSSLPCTLYIAKGMFFSVVDARTSLTAAFTAVCMLAASKPSLRYRHVTTGMLRSFRSSRKYSVLSAAPPRDKQVWGVPYRHPHGTSRGQTICRSIPLPGTAAAAVLLYTWSTAILYVELTQQHPLRTALPSTGPMRSNSKWCTGTLLVSVSGLRFLLLIHQY